MTTIQLLELEDKLQHPIYEFLLSHETYLEEEQIDDLLSHGESGLQDLRTILKAYNQHFVKYKTFENAHLGYITQVIAALAYLKDEEAFDDMIGYLKTDPELIDAAWNDSYYEELPRYFATFPSKIEELGKALYDNEIVIDTKVMLCMGLYNMPDFLEQADLKPAIAQIFLNYLEFLLVPENRKTLKSHNDWNDEAFLITNVIEGYMNCGGDGQNPSVRQAFAENLADVGFFDESDLDDWEAIPHPFDDIYQTNEAWKRVEEANRKQLVEREAEKKKEAELLQFLNATREYRKVFDRNDRVTVRYKADGKIVKDTKYKKVEDDLLKGLCEVVS